MIDTYFRRYSQERPSTTSCSSNPLMLRAAPARQRLWWTVVLLLCALAIGGCATTTSPDPIEPSAAVEVEGEVEVEIRKSPNDLRSYRYLVLDNQLRVLLVSDPETDKAAASLSVLRGYYHEPAEFQGLAHFLEHMLFIGTEKYPEIDGYQEFIAARGGQTNAYTSAEHTNYFFEVQPEYFEQSMDRFSQFFISPLLDSAYVDREKNAVHSEYQLQIRDDGWRSMAVGKTAMNPDYVGSRFYIGSLDTLGDGVAEALTEFFETQYSSDQMVLVALGNESLDSLETWIRPMFDAIPNLELGPAPKPGPAFSQSDLPSILSYQSLNDRYQVSFNFPIPAVDDYYRSKPVQYLTNLLGHEGDGSLHQLLQSKGWIESLGAAAGRLDSANAFLTIDIVLTPAGRESIDKIGEYVLGYIDILASRDPEAWRYNEQATAAELSFQYQEQSSPTGFVYRTSPNMALYPPQDVLVANYLWEGIEPDLINHYLSFLNKDNMLVEVSGPDLQTDAVERWFDVPYRLERRADVVAVPDRALMHLPEANPFLPEDLTLLEDDGQGPSLAIAQPGAQLWLDLDTEFRVPRANQYFTLGVEGGLSTARDLVLAELYQRLVGDALNDYTYPAMLAGLGYQIGTSSSGFTLGVSGYSEKQTQLLDKILEQFTTLKVTSERFELFQGELLREWRNFKNQRPYTQSYAALSNLLLNTSYDPDTLANTLEVLTVTDLERWLSERLGHVSIVGLSHGNLDLSTLSEVEGLFARHLPLAPFPLTKPVLLDVDQSWLLELPVEHNDSSMVLYVQDEVASYRSRATSALTAQILSQPYFSSLRTEQQLGYVVSMNNRTIRNRGGLIFIIQSPVASPAALEAATLEFMQEQLAALLALSDADFTQFKEGLISQLTEKAKNLRSRSGRYLADLDADVLTFDSQQQIADIVATLTLEEVHAYLETTTRRLTDTRVLIYTLGSFSDAPTLGQHLENRPPRAVTGSAPGGKGAETRSGPGHSAW